MIKEKLSSNRGKKLHSVRIWDSSPSFVWLRLLGFGRGLIGWVTRFRVPRNLVPFVWQPGLMLNTERLVTEGQLELLQGWWSLCAAVTAAAQAASPVWCPCLSLDPVACVQWYLLYCSLAMGSRGRRMGSGWRETWAVHAQSVIALDKVFTTVNLVPHS